MVLLRLITDPAAVVTKQALRASEKIFKSTLNWAASAPVLTPDKENA